MNVFEKLRRRKEQIQATEAEKRREALNLLEEAARGADVSDDRLEAAVDTLGLTVEQAAALGEEFVGLHRLEADAALDDAKLDEQATGYNAELKELQASRQRVLQEMDAQADALEAARRQAKSRAGQIRQAREESQRVRGKILARLGMDN